MAEDPALRSKYLDWCSARLAERFLALKPEAIYELAFGATDSEALASGAGASGGLSSLVGRRVSYSELVERVTEVLAARTALPSFAEWRQSYQANPALYEAELLFWRQGRTARD
ncbi:MAG: hypothetical protein ACRELD_02820 [Longimicrobiales bacterium]